MICSNCKTELPANARFCLNCGQPVRVSSSVDQERHARLAASAPTTLVEKVRAASRFTGERRLVTGLYLDVVDSTGLEHRLETDTWGKILNQAFDLASKVIYQYEGTIARVQDDELLAFFGAPVAHEDDPLRAVKASLDLLEKIRQFDQEIYPIYGEHLAVRLSLSTGPVTLGPVKSDLHYDYSALGGPLTQMARVEATRMPMTVLTTEETYRFIKPFFDCTDLGWLEPIGFARPVHVYRVVGQKEIPGSARGLVGLHSPMVGRQTELQNLLELSQVVTAGLGRVVVLLGEPGMGKTRLITEWKSASQASPTQNTLYWLEGRCLSYGQQMAYHLIVSLFNVMIGVSQTSGEPETRAALCCLIESLWNEADLQRKAEEILDVYPYLATLLSVKLDNQTQEQIRQLEPQALQSLILSAVRKLITALATQQPLVIVLEDFHWADASSVEFLAQLLPLASSERILFCFSMRPERDAPSWKLVSRARETMGNRLIELSLGSLSTTESRQLISNLLEIEALPATVRELILHKAEGNPLFVEEVIRMLIDREAIFQENGQWHAAAHIDELDIPDNLQGLLLARIDRLPDDVKHTLRVAAVIGRQFPVKVLEHILSKEEPDENS